MITVLCLLLGSYFIVLNASAPLLAKRKQRNFSMIPLLGGGLFAIGIYLLTHSILWAVLAFLIDPATLVFLIALPSLIRQFLEKT